MDLNERLRENYEAEITDYLKFMRSKGFILMFESRESQNRVVKQYNARESKFITKYHFYEIPEKVKENVPNYYSFNINNYISKKAREILPFVENDQYNSFITYRNQLQILNNPEKEREHERAEKLIKRHKKSYTEFKKNVTDYFI